MENVACPTEVICMDTSLSATCVGIMRAPINATKPTITQLRIRLADGETRLLNPKLILRRKRNVHEFSMKDFHPLPDKSGWDAAIVVTIVDKDWNELADPKYKMVFRPTRWAKLLVILTDMLQQSYRTSYKKIL